MDKITPEQALEALYNIARNTALPAKAHEEIKEAREVLAEAIQPKE